MKIATWNVNSVRARLPHVLEWLGTSQPDILALQETKIVDEDFPIDVFKHAGYDAVFSGQKSYNGVAILSRNTSLKEPVLAIPGLADEQRRVLAVTVGDVRIINVYVPNGEGLLSEKYKYKLSWLEKLTIFLQSQLEQYPKIIILGDFNIAPEDRDVYDPSRVAGQVLVSELERLAFQSIINVGFKDCFRLYEQIEREYSWWDYRLNAFQRNLGLRIDHILASPAMADKCLKCLIDKAPRGWDRPSDHAPVIAEFATC